MKTTAKKISVLVLLALIMLLLVGFVAMSVQNVAYAADEETVTEATEVQIAQEKTKQIKAWTAAIVIGAGAVTGAICMGLAIMKGVEGIARQPEAESKIRTMLTLGLVFIETVVIYTLIVAILLVFVL